jgi:NAD(P)-dependent dehydrogenase (short-subunit alcohol dehydrogenase family)
MWSGTAADRIEFASRHSVVDPVIADLASTFGAELSADGPNGVLYAETLTVGLVLHLLANYGVAKPKVPSPRGKLNAFQLRSVIDFIDAHLGEDVALMALARQAHVSTFHFARLGRPGKIVFTSSIGGLISIPFGGPYAATKHALEAIAGSMQAELAPFGIQVQVINPGGYLTGFNETEAESSSHWMDDRRNYVKGADVQGFFDRILGDEQNRLDPQLMADAMIQIIPKDTGLFRNVVPQLAEDMVETVQRDTWTNRIDLPAPK